MKVTRLLDPVVPSMEWPALQVFVYRSTTRSRSVHRERLWRVLALHVHTARRHRMLALTYSTPDVEHTPPTWRLYPGSWAQWWPKRWKRP